MALPPSFSVRRLFRRTSPLFLACIAIAPALLAQANGDFEETPSSTPSRLHPTRPSSQSARPPQIKATPEIPTFRAKTAKNARREHLSIDSTGAQIKEIVRTQGVEVDIFFSRPPTREYRVEVLFFAREESSRRTFLFDHQSSRSSLQSQKITFAATPLLGTVERSLDVPFTGLDDHGEMFIGTIRQNSSVTGAKSYGWIARFISAGHVVRVESNQRPLKELAERQPELLQAIITRFEEREPSSP